MWKHWRHDAPKVGTDRIARTFANQNAKTNEDGASLSFHEITNELFTFHAPAVDSAITFKFRHYIPCICMFSSLLLLVLLLLLARSLQMYVFRSPILCNIRRYLHIVFLPHRTRHSLMGYAFLAHIWPTHEHTHTKMENRVRIIPFRVHAK